MKFVVIPNKQIHKELATKYEESSLQILIFIFFDCTFSIFNWSQRLCSLKR